MSVEEAIAATQMAFRSLELRLFEGGAISTINGAEFANPWRILARSRPSG
jgi:hypothetical protein